MGVGIYATGSGSAPPEAARKWLCGHRGPPIRRFINYYAPLQATQGNSLGYRPMSGVLNLGNPYKCPPPQSTQREGATH